MLQADKRGIQGNLAKKKNYINGWIELSLIDELFSFLLSKIFSTKKYVVLINIF